ncbi:MAG: DNA starvation/stationary phase protection protein [Elusimicrobia bacterium]|nr:DNA starvation/stationary phase protection protein [Elusimicrobiota bacterium]
MAQVTQQKQAGTAVGVIERKEITDSLSRLLADTYLLYLKTQNFHWNVTGPMFYSLHKLFEEQYKELAEAADPIAERIRALGAPAPGSFSEFRSLSTLQESPGGNMRDEDMVFSLLDGHRITIQTASQALSAADRDKDMVTVDLLSERIHAHEKAAWMLRSIISQP